MTQGAISSVSKQHTYFLLYSVPFDVGRVIPNEEIFIVRYKVL